MENPCARGRALVTSSRSTFWLPVGALIVVLATATVTLLLARLAAPRHVSLDLSRTTGRIPEGTADRPFRVAIAPMLTPASNFEAYQLITEILASRLNLRVKMMQRGNYQEINDLIASKMADIAFVCSGAYVDLRRRKKARLLVVPESDEGTVYHSLILVRKGMPARSLRQLKGYSFAFVDPLSTSGYYYPVSRLRELGTTPGRFFRATTFTHSHERSVWMLKAELVDAAAVDCLVYHGMVREDPDVADAVRQIDRSPDFGIPPVVARLGLDEKTWATLRKVFLEMHLHHKGRRALDRLGFRRFRTAKPELYDSVASMVKTVQGGEGWRQR